MHFFSLNYFERQILRRDKKRSSICWFTPRMPTAARAEPNQRQESGASSGSPCRCRDSKTCRLALLSQAH